ncbi:DUF6668 family protein [Agrococcus casei]|uniref:DUF6668 family protein n=1 Tax=Agrococcus casei TaxID=343512 RepID=UPI003F900927
MINRTVGGFIVSEPKLNPWVTEPAPEESAPAPQEVVYESLPPATGPTTPQRGVAAPARSAQLPIQDWAASAPLWWVGAHGGAGETTLARLEPSWTAAEHAWPRTPGISKERVVLVARTHLAGLTAAQNAAQQWASGLVPGVDLIGLVLIADAPGRLPRALREFAHVVSGGVPRVWHLPWHDAWRFADPSTDLAPPSRAKRLLKNLHSITNSGQTPRA